MWKTADLAIVRFKWKLAENHSTQISEIFETETNGTEISREKFQKIWKLLNFRKANHSTKNSGNSGLKVKWNGNLQKKIFRKFGYTSRGCPLSLEALFSIIQSAWNSSVTADELSESHKRYLNARRSDVKLPFKCLTSSFVNITEEHFSEHQNSVEQNILSS